MNEMLPIFVYGTLRPGGMLNDALKDSRWLGTATLNDHALYRRWEDAPFPYMLSQPGSRVVGDLAFPWADRYTAILSDLDRIEGFHPMNPQYSSYLRVRVDVTLDGRSVAAWAYVAPANLAARLVATGVAVPGNDWAPYNVAPIAMHDATPHAILFS